MKKRTTITLLDNRGTSLRLALYLPREMIADYVRELAEIWRNHFAGEIDGVILDGDGPVLPLAYFVPGTISAHKLPSGEQLERELDAEDRELQPAGDVVAAGAPIPVHCLPIPHGSQFVNIFSPHAGVEMAIVVRDSTNPHAQTFLRILEVVRALAPTAGLELVMDPKPA